MADAAVIFDVDGVLLDLTRAEEDLFFAPFERRYGLMGLSRDWDSYRTRNDEEIVAEIFERHGLPSTGREPLIAEYLGLLKENLAPLAIPGVHELLEQLAGNALGIATANFREAARLRLVHLDLWHHVETHAFGADGGGAKRDIVARAAASTGHPKSRIVFVGDNLNDVEAGLANGIHFIGFSLKPGRLEKLAAGGARHLSNSHETTLEIIRDLLGGL